MEIIKKTVPTYKTVKSGEKVTYEYGDYSFSTEKQALEYKWSRERQNLIKSQVEMTDISLDFLKISKLVVKDDSDPELLKEYDDRLKGPGTYWITYERDSDGDWIPNEPVTDKKFRELTKILWNG